MIADEIGTATLHTRVESWECDHNKHWNARYYARSFQMAAETVAALAGRENYGLSVIAARIHLVQRARSAVRPNDSHMKPSEPPQMRHAATMRDHFDVVMQVATVIGDPHRFVRGIQAHL